MENSERWRPLGGGMNPSARLKAARAMPPWLQSRGAAYPPPPPPPVEEPPIDPDYEVIEFPGQTYSNAPIQEIKQRVDGKRCDLCGSSAPSVHCTQCTQNFCPSCDDMYHRHPKRQTHLRKSLDGKQTVVRPPLPPKGEAAPPPVPPPRRNKRMSRTPLPPSPLDQSPTAKVGFVGSLKRMVGGRPLPAAPFTPNGPMGHPHQPDLPLQMGGYPRSMVSDWEMKNQHRSGSFTNLHGPGFNPLMQAHSMAQLNCPSCQHGVVWDPWQQNMVPPSPMGHPQWGGIPPSGTWHSSAMLNRRSSQESFRRNSLRRHQVRDSSSGSEDDDRVPHNRRRNPSPALSRRSRNPRSDYESEEDERDRNWGRSAPSPMIPRRASMAEGINRVHRQDDDTLSVHGGRRSSHQSTLNRRESTGNTFERNPRREYDRNLERRGSRRNDFDAMSNQSQRRYEPEATPRTRRRTLEENRTNYIEDGRSSRGSHKGTSEFEDSPSSGFRSGEPNFLNEEGIERRKSRRNERFTDTGRRRTSPINYKYPDSTIDTNIAAQTEDISQNGVGENEEEEEELGPIPETQWECVHCTFINEPGTRVCTICCKTTSKPKPTVEAQPKVPKETRPQKGFGSQRETKVVKDYDRVTFTESMRKMKIETSPQPMQQKSQGVSPVPQRKGNQTDSRKNLTSTGTSPPPQSISTQTYDVAGVKLKRATSLADYAEWRAPQRSFSKQSLLSDTQSLPVTPPKGRSPERFNQDMIPPEQPPSRKNSDQFSTSQRNLRRAGSQPPDYISTLVQKQVKQGLEMVKLLREAEEQQFSADDLAVALLHCEDGDPVAWLQQNWRNMIDTVVTLGTNYGHERKENTVGTISASEAREALRLHDGNVWAAVTECVEQRQKKYAELLSRGNFSREDIVTVLTANHGNLEAAYMELSKSQLKPFLMRIWGPPQGADNESGDFTKLAHGTEWEGGKSNKKDEEVSLLSSDSNNDRIQTWLDNYVHKPKLSQSMLQLNSVSSKNSDSSDLQQSSPKYQNTRFNRNRRYSDVNRYLTHCFTGNNSLQIAHKHSSMQELDKPVEKSDPLKEFLKKNLEQGCLLPKMSLSVNSTIGEGSSNQNSVHEDGKLFVPTESGLNSSNTSPEPNLKEDNQLSTNQITGSSTEQTSLESEHLLNSPEPTQNLSNTNNSSSESEQDEEEKISVSSSESYESIDMDSDEDSEESEYENNTLKNESGFLDFQILNDIRSQHEIENRAQEEKIIKPVTNQTTEVPNSGEMNTDSNLDDPENSGEVITVRIPIKIHDRQIPQDNFNSVSNNVTEITHIVNEILNENLITVDNSQLNTTQKPTTEENDASQSNKNEMEQNYNGNETQDRIVYENIIQTQEETIITKVPTINFEDDHLEDNSHNSVEFPPLTAIHFTDSKSPLVYTSDGNSDIDISPIPTDSEREPNSEQNLDKNITDAISPLRNSSQELVSLLKESLSKEDVVEKIVSTLFQSVLRASIDLQQFPTLEPNRLLNRRHSKISVDSRNTSDLEENSENMFYEAEENQERHLSGTSGLGSDDFNTSVDTNDDSVKIIQEPTSENVQTLLVKQNELETVEAKRTEELLETTATEQTELETTATEQTELETIDAKQTEEVIETIDAKQIELETIDLPTEAFNNTEIIPEQKNDEDALTEEKEDLGNNEREVRRMLAEGLVKTYSQAELVVQLKDLNFDEEQCFAAAAECNSVETAIAYLQQECYLCAGKYTMMQMVSMLDCEHICCLDCAKNYFTLQITERTINDCVCPFCKGPDISKLEEDKALHYFSNLDILLKTLVKENVHELFQRKLRDRTLMQDPNFIWCGQCSSGFIANPRQKRLICPDCKNISCASCRKTWQKEHEKMTCGEFKDWLEYNDPENQLERHLAENGVTCPKCKARYVLAKGGCMHLICPHCKHEFCQGCGMPFLMGNNCKVSQFCEKLGLHSHHPRNCLFYLRDKEPADLQRLLEENGIDYRKPSENLSSRCNVQLLKETDDGLVEAICGYPIEGCGLCRTHFVEHLVFMIRDNKVDPVVVMDAIDAQQELRRHGKPLPTREDYKSDHEYLAVCMKIIREHIPLD